MENQVKRTERGDKIKLEDMTLADIKELKECYKIRVAEALSAIRNEFMEKYDCGFPIVKVYSDVEHDVVEDGMDRPLWEEYRPQCEIQIKFSKEDD